MHGGSCTLNGEVFLITELPRDKSQCDSRRDQHQNIERENRFVTRRSIGCLEFDRPIMRLSDEGDGAEEVVIMLLQSYVGVRVCQCTSTCVHALLRVFKCLTFWTWREIPKRSTFGRSLLSLR